MSCAVHARDLRFTYPNGTVGLAGVDFHVTHGERVAILGPNGAGKTTLMLHLNALLVGEGSLEVAGLQVGRDDARGLRARVGLVFQDPDDQLFMPTVREDVAFGPLNMGLERALAHEQAVEVEHQRRLARPVGAEDRDALAVGDMEVDAVEADHAVRVRVAQPGGVDGAAHAATIRTESRSVPKAARKSASARRKTRTSNRGIVCRQPRASIARCTRSARS